VTTAVETDKAVDAETVKRAEAETPEFVRKSGGYLPTKVLQFTVLALKRGDGTCSGSGSPARKLRAKGHTRTGVGPRIPDHGRGAPVCLLRILRPVLFGLGREEIWEKHLGRFKMKAQFGEGVSPVLCGEQIIINQDQEGPGFLAAFDRKTGAETWRVSARRGHLLGDTTGLGTRRQAPDRRLRNQEDSQL